MGIKIKDTKGVIVYTSPSTKIEMTAAMIETFFLEPGCFHGTSFKIEKTKGVLSTNEPFLPGEYTISAAYSTTHLSGRANLKIPIGSWQSNIVKIKVLDICEVHKTKMEKKEVPIRWGLLPAPGPNEPTYVYRMRNFPHAQEFVAGGCVLPTIAEKKTEKTLICPDCQKAEKEWFKNHGDQK